MQSIDERLAVLEKRLVFLDEGFSDVVSELTDGPLARQVSRLASEVARLKHLLGATVYQRDGQE